MLKRLSAQFGGSNTDLPATLQGPRTSIDNLNTLGYDRWVPPSPSVPSPRDRASLPVTGPPQTSPLSSKSLLDSSPNMLDRQSLHKSLRALEDVLAALDEFRHASDLLVKSQRRLQKSAKALSACMKESSSKDQAEKDPVINGLVNASILFETSSDSDLKFAKIVQVTYDSTNGACAKAFKKISARSTSLRLTALFFS